MSRLIWSQKLHKCDNKYNSNNYATFKSFQGVLIILSVTLNTLSTWLFFTSFCFCWIFQKILSRISSVSNSLNPKQGRQFVGPDLGPNCWQGLSANNTNRQLLRERSDLCPWPHIICNNNPSTKQMTSKQHLSWIAGQCSEHWNHLHNRTCWSEFLVLKKCWTLDYP